MNNEWIIFGSTGNKYTVRLVDNIFECSCIGFENHDKCYHSSYIKDCVSKKIKPKQKASFVNKINIFNK